ncbi:MAG: hypothetical protein V1923_05725 [Candidatus Omnitrophota bacterium]
MKTVVICLSVFFLAGCFFVVKDGDQVKKIYGSPKGSVLEVLNKLEEAKPKEKKEIITIQAEPQRIK